MRIGQECGAKEEFPRNLTKKAAQLGFIGVFIKKEYGATPEKTLKALKDLVKNIQLLCCRLRRPSELESERIIAKELLIWSLIK